MAAAWAAATVVITIGLPPAASDLEAPGYVAALLTKTRAWRPVIQAPDPGNPSRSTEEDVARHMDNAPPKAGEALVCGRIGPTGASDPSQFFPGRVSLLGLRQARLRARLREAVRAGHGPSSARQLLVEVPDGG